MRSRASRRMSPELSWTVEREAGISLVGCRVHNDATDARRVRIRSRLDEPVLPPRRSGIPEAGWDAIGVTVRLGPDERRGLGFASTAAPVDPPVEIDEVERVGGDIDGDRADDIDEEEPSAATAAAAVRDLGDHRPPRGTTVASDVEAAGTDGTVGSGGGDADEIGSDPDRPGAEPPDPAPDGTDREQPAGVSSSSPVGPDTGENRLRDWFDAVERRIERAERLTDADLEAATEGVAALGGVDGVPDLKRQVDADAARLRRASERASALAARAESTDVPRESLERLA